MGDGLLKTALFVIGLAESRFDAGRRRLLPLKILQQADGFIELTPAEQGFCAIEIRLRWTSTGLLRDRARKQRQPGEQDYRPEEPHFPRWPDLRPAHFRRRKSRYAVPVSLTKRCFPVASKNRSEAQTAIVA